MNSPSLHTLHDFEHTLGAKFDARRTDTFKNDFTYSIDLFIHYSNTYLRRRKIPAVFCRIHMMTVLHLMQTQLVRVFEKIPK